MKFKEKILRTKLGHRGMLFAAALWLSTGKMWASGGLTDATGQIAGYLPSVQKLVYAIAAVISIVGAFNIYFKMQNGDQDVKKTIMLTIGGCIALVALSAALPTFFGHKV